MLKYIKLLIIRMNNKFRHQILWNYIHFEYHLLGNRNKSASFYISCSSLRFLVWCNDGKFQPKEAHIHKRAILFSRKAKLILWRIWMKWVAEMHWTKKLQQITFQIWETAEDCTFYMLTVAKNAAYKLWFRL